jgi:hypothetical protein
MSNDGTNYIGEAYKLIYPYAKNKGKLSLSSTGGSGSILTGNPLYHLHGDDSEFTIKAISLFLSEMSKKEYITVATIIDFIARLIAQGVTITNQALGFIIRYGFEKQESSAALNPQKYYDEYKDELHQEELGQFFMDEENQLKVWSEYKYYTEKAGSEGLVGITKAEWDDRTSRLTSSSSAPSGGGGGGGVTPSIRSDSIANKFYTLKELLEDVHQDEIQNLLRRFFGNVPPDDGRVWRVLMKNDVKVPFGYVIYRPSETYLMGMLIACARSSQGSDDGVGYMYFHDPDLLVGEDVWNQTGGGSFTMYSKAVVENAKLVVKLPDVFCKGYIRGGGMQPFPLLDKDERDNYRDGNMQFDLIPTPRPMNFRCDHAPYDMTGSFQDGVNANEQEKLGTKYKVADLLCQLMGWYHPDTTPFSTKWDQSMERIAYYNTFCYQTVQLMYNHATKQYDKVIRANGQFGEEIGPGCMTNRNGIFNSTPVSYNYTQQNVTKVVVNN